jgi:DHA1 family multidrug resistance protein-like MFS transporter
MCLISIAVWEMRPVASDSGPVNGLTRALSSAKTALPVDLRRLVLIGFVEISAVNFYVSILMPYYRSLGYGSEVAGVLTSVLQVVGALVAVGAGFMADTLGRKKLYVAGQLFRCAAAGLLMVTRSYAGLVLISVMRGMAGIQSPAQSAILASHTRRQNRATLYGLLQTASQAASVVTPLAAGYLADRFGVMASFGTGLLLASVAVIIAIPLKEGANEESSCQVERPVASEQTPVAAESVQARVVRMFKENRPAALYALLGASLINGLTNGATNILLPFMVMDRFSSAYTTVSSASSFSALGTMLVLLIGGRIADLRGRRGLVLVSGFIFPVLMIGLFAVNALWQLFTILVLITMAANIGSPAISAVYMEAVGDRDRATFAGLQMSLNNAGMALGSVAAGIGYKLNPTWSWIVVIALFASQLPLYAVAIPREKGN